ncbi:MAG: H-NS histone family protein [Hydrogenophilales bacterium]|nr:H-NS histone family protein [Hydrogenophilales bacterium]
MRMKIDLKSLSVDELNELKKSVAVELELRQHGERQKLFDEFRERARALGVTTAELMATVTGKRKGPKSVGVAKFANPADKSQTWTGKGKRPRWVHDALNAGKTLDDLKI